PIVVTVLIGFGLGCIPGLKEHFHWKIWFIFPMSGILLGAGLGWTQFFICYALNQVASGWRIVALALTAVASYLAIEFGVYYSTSIPVRGMRGVPDGDYRLAELMSFSQYMLWQLGSSTVTIGDGIKVVELGAAGTTISFLIDLAGAFAAAGGMLLIGS